MKKGRIVIITFVFIIGLLIITNPSLEDYNEYTANELERLGLTKPETPKTEIERINFYIFSTYSLVIVAIDDHVDTRLGIMGKFFDIQDNQYDYPWWLEPFN